MVDEAGEVVLDIYRKTAGDPISEWIIYTAATESCLLKEGRASVADRLSAGIRNRFIAMDETA